MTNFLIVSSVFTLLSALCVEAQIGLLGQEGICGFQPFNPTAQFCRFGRGLRRRDCINRGCCISLYGRRGCYERGDRRPTLSFRPSQTPQVGTGQGGGGLTSFGLTFGGQPGYRGSSIQKFCGTIGLPCGLLPAIPFRGSRRNLIALRSVCWRHGCCWNSARKQCFRSRYHVTSLRSECPPGFENPPACTDINDCASTPCANQGTCRDGIDSFQCECASGVSGTTCTEVCFTIPSGSGGATPNPSSGPLNTNDRVTFTCPNNYQLIGSGTITCQRDGTFSPQPPTCVQLCGDPPATDADLSWVITNTNSSYLDDMSIVYSCPTGQTLTPTMAINQCVDGNWLNPSPSCYTCDVPPLPTGGNGGYLARPHTLVTMFDALTTVTYACYSGATLFGSLTTQCQTDRSWSNPPPECSTALCPPVPPVNAPSTEIISISNGITSTGQDPAPVGTIIIYQCMNGLVQLTSEQAQSVCTSFANGPSWSLNNGPSCIPGCSLPTTFPGTGDPSIPGGVYPPPTQITLVCPSGTFPSPISTVTCNGGTLQFTDIDTVNCVSGCGPPDQLMFGMALLGPNYAVGTTLTYICNPGLVVEPAFLTTRCGSQLTWSLTTLDPNFPICYCPTPVPTAAVQAATPSSNSQIRPLTDVSYQCAVGLVTPPGISNQCSPSGSWALPSGDVNLPTCNAACTPAQPPNAPTMNNAGTTGLNTRPTSSLTGRTTGFAVGDTVTYTCIDPEQTIADAESTCQAGANGWDLDFNSIGICQTTRCGPPVIPQNSGVQLVLSDPPVASMDDAFDVNTMLTYFCLPTYRSELSASLRVTMCQSSGLTWSRDGEIATTLNCRRACGEPQTRSPATAVSLGMNGGPNYFYLATAEADLRTRVNYECPFPLVRVPSDIENICEMDGTWSITDISGLPSCVCSPPLPSFANIDQTLIPAMNDGYLPDTTVNYACETGFRIVPENSVNMCTSSGWSDPTASNIACVRECGDVPVVTNGPFTFTSSPTPGNAPYVEGTEGMYVCNSGTTIDDPNLAMNSCGSSGDWSRSTSLPNLPTCRPNDPDVNMIVLLDASSAMVEPAQCNIFASPPFLATPPEDYPTFVQGRAVVEEIIREYVAFTSERSSISVAFLSNALPPSDASCTSVVAPSTSTTQNRLTELMGGEIQCGSVSSVPGLSCAEQEFTSASGFLPNIPLICLIVRPNLSEGDIMRDDGFLAQPETTFQCNRICYIMVSDTPPSPAYMTMINNFLAEGAETGAFLGRVAATSGGSGDSVAQILQSLRAIL